MIFTCVEFIGAPFLSMLFSNHPTVSSISSDYFSYRILGLPFLSICLVVRGFWSGLSQPMRYLKVIVFIHGLNIFLNYVFIFGNFGLPPLGAAGAGLSSTLSLIIGTIIYLYDIRSYLRLQPLLRNINRGILSEFEWLVRLALPTAIQQFIFATGFSVFYWILGQIGINELALGNVLVNIILIGILPGVGFGMATMTLVSESLGNGDMKNTHYWPFRVAKIAVMIIGPLCLFIMFFPTLVLRPFIIDPHLLQQAINPLRLDCLGVLFEVGALIFMNALNAVEQTKLVACLSSICQWLFFLPLAYGIGVLLNFGFMGIWFIWAIYQFLQLVLFAGIWQRRYGRASK